MNRQGFTVIELIVVVTLIAIATGFAVTSFIRTIKIAEEREAIMLAQNIRAYVRMWESKYDGNPPAMPDVKAINETLGTNLVQKSNIKKMWCGPMAGTDEWGCGVAVKVDNKGGAKTIHFHRNPDEIHCDGNGKPCLVCHHLGPNEEGVDCS